MDVVRQSQSKLQTSSSLSRLNDLDDKGQMSESEMKRRSSNEQSPKMRKKSKGRQSPLSSSVKSSPMMSNKKLKITQLNEGGVEPINENEFEN